MPKYVITHGSLKTPGGTLGVGATVELTETEAKHIDPQGLMLSPNLDAPPLKSPQRDSVLAKQAHADRVKHQNATADEKHAHHASKKDK